MFGRRWAGAIVVAALAMTTGCESVGRRGAALELEAGVSRQLAAQRHATLEDLRYELMLTVPKDGSAPLTGEVVVTVVRGAGGGDLVLDFAPRRQGKVEDVRVNGESVAWRHEHEHLVVEEKWLRKGENSVRVSFVADPSCLLRQDALAYSLFVPAKARFAFPCFDQPDLKARYKLTIRTVPDWKVVGNGALLTTEDDGDWVRWEFAETEPISTYLFAFAAGDFEVVSHVRDGREIRLLHREKDPDKIAASLEPIFDYHFRAIDWFEAETGASLPFGKFEVVAVPAFPYGGMEHPGTIFYRDSLLFLEPEATQDDRLDRAHLIVHETAHQWFGNLVTMRWFDDVWTKEVFANFYAAKMVNPLFPEIDHELAFLEHHRRAYSVDRTDGANPIRQPLANLDGAGSIYGEIIYYKAPVVMAQLELLVGEAGFRRGIRRYLRDFAYANATWPELIAILDEESAVDLAEWSRVWVDTGGRPRIRTELELDSEGRIERLALRPEAPDGGADIWPQRLTVVVGTPLRRRQFEVTLDAAVVAIPEANGLQVSYVLPNGGGLGYGAFELDQRTVDYLLKGLVELPTPLLRAVAWLDLVEMMRDGTVPPDRLVAAGIHALPQEQDEVLARRLAYDLAGVSRYWVRSDLREEAVSAVEAALAGIAKDAARSDSVRRTCFEALLVVAETGKARDELREIWEAERVGGLTLTERQATTTAQTLAVLGIADAEAILDRQRERIKTAQQRERFDFVRPSLAADKAVRDAFFASLLAPENRSREPWVLEGVRWLHHPKRLREADGYLWPALEEVAEIRETGGIFFPKAWLDAVLGNRRSATDAATVRRFLAEELLAPDLRAKVLQSADGLFRVSEMGGQ